MRITGGKARNINILTPGKNSRPATDALRESIFSSIGGLIEGASILDLFAGSGAYGLEALSRGADSISFVEKNAQALSCIKKNVESVQKALGSTTDLKNIRFTLADIFKWQPEKNKFYDIVFIDPPYELLADEHKKILKSIHLYLKPSEYSRIILEAPGKFEVPKIPDFECIKRLGKKSPQQPTAIIFAPAHIC